MASSWDLVIKCSRIYTSLQNKPKHAGVFKEGLKPLKMGQDHVLGSVLKFLGHPCAFRYSWELLEKLLLPTSHHRATWRAGALGRCSWCTAAPQKRRQIFKLVAQGNKGSCPAHHSAKRKHICWWNQEYFSIYFCGEDIPTSLLVSTALLRDEIYWWVGNGHPNECLASK